MAQTVREKNWRAIKFRAHFQTINDDVAVVEQTRKLMGKDFIITVDANQAGEAPDGSNQGEAHWDYSRREAAVAPAEDFASHRFR